jgi:hypothetical protein
VQHQQQQWSLQQQQLRQQQWQQHQVKHQQVEHQQGKHQQGKHQQGKHQQGKHQQREPQRRPQRRPQRQPHKQVVTLDQSRKRRPFQAQKQRKQPQIPKHGREKTKTIHIHKTGTRRGRRKEHDLRGLRKALLREKGKATAIKQQHKGKLKSGGNRTIMIVPLSKEETKSKRTIITKGSNPTASKHYNRRPPYPKNGGKRSPRSTNIGKSNTRNKPSPNIFKGTGQGTKELKRFNFLSRNKQRRANIRKEFGKKKLKMLKVQFDALDHNNNKTLDVREMILLFKALECPVSKRQVLHLITDIDLDKSGTLDFEEFLVLYQKILMAQPQEGGVFSTAKKNLNGMSKKVQELYQEQARFQKWKTANKDRNRNGTISNMVLKQEFRKEEEKEKKSRREAKNANVPIDFATKGLGSLFD